MSRREIISHGFTGITSVLVKLTYRRRQVSMVIPKAVHTSVKGLILSVGEVNVFDGSSTSFSVGVVIFVSCDGCRMYERGISSTVFLECFSLVCLRSSDGGVEICVKQSLRC